MRINEIGKRYGKLTVVAKSRSGGAGVGVYWTTLCDCGTTREVLGRRLRAGAVSSCGDCNTRNAKHIPGSRLPKGMKLKYKQLVLQAARKGVMQLSAGEYKQKCETARCISCNSLRAHGEWGEPDGPFNVTNLITICEGCSEYRNKRSIRKTLEWLIRVSRHMSRISMMQFR